MPNPINLFSVLLKMRRLTALAARSGCRRTTPSTTTPVSSIPILPSSSPRRLAFFSSSSSSSSAPSPLSASTEGRIREQTHATIKGRKRFYQEVGVRKAASDGDGDGGQPSRFEVTLDGRPLRSPGRRLMHFENEAMACALALEWDAQGGKRGIEPSTMPLMSLVSTWLDQTDQGRDEVIRNVFKYLQTDTACFYAEPEIRVLLKRQRKTFRRLHEWMEDEWDAPLATTDAVFKLDHPPESVARVAAMVDSLDTA